jgi:RNA-binding protein PNO1
MMGAMKGRKAVDGLKSSSRIVSSRKIMNQCLHSASPIDVSPIIKVGNSEATQLVVMCRLLTFVNVCGGGRDVCHPFSSIHFWPRTERTMEIVDNDEQQHQGDYDDDDVEDDVDQQQRPNFPQLSAVEAFGGKTEYRRIRCPPHRMTPLRNEWEHLMSPIVEFLKLQIRFNPKNRSVELKTSEFTEDPGAIQKGQDFIEAFMMGFEIQDAVAMLRLDDLFIDSFMVTDVKILNGDHLSRAIGRVAGQDGKTKYAIENATRTRIVIADQKIHIMGSFANIKLARDAICNLIMGAPPGKVYNQMRNVARRLNERF